MAMYSTTNKIKQTTFEQSYSSRIVISDSDDFEANHGTFLFLSENMTEIQSLNTCMYSQNRLLNSI